jgi:hypothetical protein
MESAQAASADGRHGFDFLMGSWLVANHKKVHPLRESDDQWVDFEATTETRSILAGLGNVETYRAPSFPGRPNYEGLSLRLFDPATGRWNIWWSSTARPGSLEVPVCGRFVDGVGNFYSDEVIDGRRLKLRFTYQGLTRTTAHWQQAFSFDEGASWHANWSWSLTRLPSEAA